MEVVSLNLMQEEKVYTIFYPRNFYYERESGSCVLEIEEVMY